jgi:hypothetical protein
MYTFLFIVLVVVGSLLLNSYYRSKTTDKDQREKNENRRSTVAVVLLIAGILVINSISFGDEPYQIKALTPKEITSIVGDSVPTGTYGINDGAEPDPPLAGDVDNQFDQWDGAHRKTEEYVKAHLSNPASYTHEVSHYKVHPDFLEVILTYSYTNSDGEVVAEKAHVKCDLETGEVLGAM